MTTSSRLEELRDGLSRCATIESAQGPKVDARRARGAAAVLERLPRAGGRPARCARPRPRRRSAWGAGAGASPLVSGHMALHRELEARLAELKGTEACVLFGSGYLANTGVIAALATRRRGRLRRAQPRLDRRRLPARARARRWSTRTAIGARPARARRRRDVIVTDAVFSMDGDVAPLAGIVALARDRRARDRRRGARDRRDRAGRPRAGGRARAGARGRRRDRDARQGARLLRRVRVLRRARSRTTSSTARGR